MRFSLVLLLLGWSSLAAADWTGVELELAKFDTDWRIDVGEREAQLGSISFQIEERTESGLSIGAGIGYVDLRLLGDTAADTLKFDGQFFGIYLRQPIPVNEFIALHGLLSYRYYSAGESGEDEDASIDWSEIGLDLGIGIRFDDFRLTAFARYVDIDGDVSGDNGIDVFEGDESLSRGIRFDYFVETTAFLRIELLAGASKGGYLKFIRRY